MYFHKKKTNDFICCIYQPVIVVLVRTLSPKVIEMASLSPFRYCNEAQPGPLRGTTGMLNSLQQLHIRALQLQYLFGEFTAESCRVWIALLCFLTEVLRDLL